MNQDIEQVHEVMNDLTDALCAAETVFKARFGGSVFGGVPIPGHEGKTLSYAKRRLIFGGAMLHEGNVKLDLKIAGAAVLKDLWQELLSLQNGRLAEVREATKTVLDFIEQTRRGESE